MTVYNIVFIFLLIAALTEAVLWYRNSLRINIASYATGGCKSKYKRKVRVFLLIEIAILFFISAVRAPTVGTDMQTYIPRYEIIAQNSWGELKNLADLWNFETGFVVFCKLISLIHPNSSQIFTIVTSICVSVGFYLFIKNYSFLPQMSLFIFVSYGYWTNSFNTVRQYMTLSILLIALLLWRKNKTGTKLFAIVLTAIAISFHLTSLCFVVLYFIKNKRISKKAFSIILLIGLLLFFTPTSFVDQLLSLTPYGKYADRRGSGEVTLIVLLCIYAFLYLQRQILNKRDKNAGLWFWMFSIAVLMNVLALKIGLFERIMRIFLVSLLSLIPNAVYVLKKNAANLCVYCTILIFFSLYFYLVLMNSQESSGYTIPYLPFWA